MNPSQTVVETTLRIPGDWSEPGELMDKLPDGYRVTAEALVLPDETEIWIGPRPPDDQFAHIFRSSCRQPATREELAIVNRYTVNVVLIGPGGSRDGARKMLQAGAAIVRAGAAGVFIDNCGLAHGGASWLEMADDGGPDAISFAFVNIIRGAQEVYTMGQHVLGLPEIVMKRSDADADDRAIIELIRYMAASDKPVAPGHILAAEDGARYRTVAVENQRFDSGPMFNPYGRLRLVSIKDIAESN